MSSVKAQLRELASYLDTEFPDVGLDELTSPEAVPTVRLERFDHPLSRQPSGWVVATAAAALVLFLMGGAAWLLRGDAPEVADEPTVTTVAPSVTVTTVAPALTTTVPGTIVAPARQPPTSWTRIDTEMAPSQIAAGPAGFVSVDWLSQLDTVMWSSGDGETWHSQVLETDGCCADGSGVGMVDSVAFGGPGYVAFGGHWGIDVRFSTDGENWVPAAHVDAGSPPETTSSGEPAPGTYGRIEGIAFGNGRYVAVGDLRDHGDNGYSNPRAAVWTSVDGLAWTQLAEDDEVFDGPWHQAMYDVAYGAAGFVAVGSTDGDDGESSVGAIWHSPDGTVWTRVAHDEELLGTHINGQYRGLWQVTHGDDGYVAIGWNDVLVSTDGLTWTRVPDESLPGSFSFLDVAHGDGAYVLVGYEWFPDPNNPEGQLRDTAIWYSTDTATWTRVPENVLGEPAAEPSSSSGSVAFANGRFVVVGYDELWPDPTGPPVYAGRLWIGEADR